MIKIAPSLLSADFLELGKQIDTLKKCGIELIHFDVMDGMFVPNISFGIPVLKSLKKKSPLPFDVHLMIEQPSRYIDDFIDAGSDIITIHYEAEKHLDRTLNYIKSKGAKAGIAINPGTPVSNLYNLIEIADLVLVMTVNPGFGGQKYIKYCSDKVRDVRSLSKKAGVNTLIEVDGGIDASTISDADNCGADFAVAGSAVFKNGDIENNILKLNEALKK